jgi:hypothetical protein
MCVDLGDGRAAIVAARNADAARARIARRVAEADQLRAAAILDRAAVERAARDVSCHGPCYE